MRDPFLSFRSGGRGVVLSYVVVGNRKKVESELEVLLVLLRSIPPEMPARAVDDADVPI